MAIVKVKGISYHMDNSLKEKWDKLKEGGLSKIDEDRFYVTDGQEGAGKSIFTIQQAAYIDPTILNDENDKVLPRICFSVDEFLYAVRNTKSNDKETKVVVFDEAFRGMSSKSALSSVNKKVVQALMEMRQNNLIVFLVTPSYFLLELYAAMLRSKALFHVVKKKNSTRRYVRIFNFQNKAKLYQIGIRKGWGYPILTRNRVNFFNKYPGGSEFEQKYRKKKYDSFKDNEKNEESIHKWKLQRNICIKILYNMLGTYEKVVEILKKWGFETGITTIHDIINKNKR